jgi:hemolysin III
MTDPIARPPRHYPTPAAKCADLIVHVTGLVLALVGAGVALGLSVRFGGMSEVAAVAIYAVGLVLMLSFSTAYNFGKAPWRPLLRRLDHAGIFLMIAGSYTPFTTHSLKGAWAWGMTSLVWAVALLGVFGKLFLPGLGKRFWVGVYLALGWIAVVALRPLMAGLNWLPLGLLALGGLLYTSGVIFYVNKKLKFARAIWHGHVVAAAGAHWTAILLGVVLATAR